MPGLCVTGNLQRLRVHFNTVILKTQIKTKIGYVLKSTFDKDKTTTPGTSCPTLYVVVIRYPFANVIAKAVYSCTTVTLSARTRDLSLSW